MNLFRGLITLVQDRYLIFKGWKRLDYPAIVKGKRNWYTVYYNLNIKGVWTLQAAINEQKRLEKK